MEAMKRSRRASIIEIKIIPPQPSENLEKLFSIIRSIGDEIEQTITGSEINEITVKIQNKVT